MKRQTAALVLVVVLVLVGVAYAIVQARRTPLVITGIVTTNDVVISPQTSGQIGQLLVREGESVARDQLLALIVPDEMRADTSYYSHTAEGLSSQVQEAAAALRYQKQQTAQQIRQAEATLAASEAQVSEANADLENARQNLERIRGLSREQVATPQQLDQAQAAYDAARAHVEALKKQVDAQRAAVALAQANADQVAVRENQLRADQQQFAAANAQRAKADVRLGYTEIHAPVSGIVDVRVAQPGEVVAIGQPVMTLVNPDDLWVRADVPETYIDRIRLGERLTVRLPSGIERAGTVFFRGIDADFATQRDVSRTKRDIKTFEVRLRVDNRDRRLAVGMTAYVVLPFAS